MGIDSTNPHSRVPQNQTVRTYMASSTILVVALVILAISPAWHQSEKSLERKALSQAESIGFQLAESQISSRRNLAAVAGSISKDPWGLPYQYKMFEVAEGVRVEVWSQHSQQLKTFVEIPKNLVKKDQ